MIKTVAYNIKKMPVIVSEDLLSYMVYPYEHSHW